MPRTFLFLLTMISLSTAQGFAKPAYIGWAQEAHPDYSDETFTTHLKEQKKFGANLVWIGHNNPGYVDKNKVEPGLSYAVYEALQDTASPHHADAVVMAAAVKRLLNAARQQGFKAVLAIGYQIQMGPVWNDRHPEALRREHDGRLFTAGGPSASFLSPIYQRDIQEYYRWVYREVVLPYKDVLLMLNLADEPHGGDYSVSAETAFKAETGLTWHEAGKTAAGLIKKGRFQNLYVVEYARWSANVWKTIDPSVHVTMSFCGNHGRFSNAMPNIAEIFRQTPENFDVTFDAFLIDTSPGDPIDGKHVSALAMFLRQVGELSQRYHKRVWLWPEANNWILSQWGSAVKGNISDVLFGITLLRNMSAGAGIHLGGLAVWNLDVKEQGLFRDTHALFYDPERMFQKVSADFATQEDPVQLSETSLVWIPQSETDYLIGRKSYGVAERVYQLGVYATLLERGIIPRLSSDSIPPLEGTTSLFLISKYSPHLTPEGYQRLETFVREGGLLVCNYPILRKDNWIGRLFLNMRFYGNALLAKIFQHSRTLRLAWGRGEMVIVVGQMDEKRRNVITELPLSVVDRIAPKKALPVDAGSARGVLSFPQKKAWLFYNTNPNPVTLTLASSAKGAYTNPDGNVVRLKAGESSVVLLHGAWLELAL